MPPSDSRTFLALPENRLAVAAVRRLAPGTKRRSVRIVTVVAPPGTGKSHLARELLRSWEQSGKEGRRLLVTASEFAAHLAEASAANKISQFQTRYRHNVQLLACEDVQVLGARKETQQQLLAAIDDVIAKDGLVLLTSTLMPGEIKGLSRRLINRMHGGICVTMELPGQKSRRRLIEQFLITDSLRITPEEVETIAARSNVSPRELRGLLAQLRSEKKSGNGTSPQRELASLLEERHPSREVSLEAIAKESASRYRVKLADLKGPRRSQTISMARQVAMFLARDLAGMNYADIGAYFNRSNHSTVIHACRKIAAQRNADPVLEHELDAIAQTVSAAARPS